MLTAGIPLYVQMREALRAEFANALPGTAVPTELELVERFRVSRITVRRSIEDLVQEGLMVRVRGRGTFVQEPKLTHELNTITSWSEQLTRTGFAPQTSRRSVCLEAPSVEVAEALGLSSQQMVVRLERLRLADRQPLSLMTNYLPQHLVPDFSIPDPPFESLYDYLEERYGLVLGVAVDTVETRRASREEASALKLPRGAPVIKVTRAGYLEDGTPLELAHVVSRGDRYQYQVSLRGRHRGAMSGLDSLPEGVERER